MSATQKSNRIYLSPPFMNGREREYLLDAFDSNWIAPIGPHVDMLERDLAAAVELNHAAALSSGTAALHLALQLVGVQSGDEVLTSSLTFAATANAITYLGAKPVFIDSARDTWNIDPNLLADELRWMDSRGQRPKAIVTVDLYGQCADYDPIVELCQKYEVPLIEDAAEALGATYKGKFAGTFGDIGCFSFNGNKIITGGGGGAFVSNNADFCQRARFLATQARDPAPHYEHSTIGYNYRMSNLNAAVARGQLEWLDANIAKRRAIFQRYRDAISDRAGATFMPEPAGFRSTRWLTCMTVDEGSFGCNRDQLLSNLSASNIESRPVWKPMHLQPIYGTCRVRGGDIAANLFRTGLCLPSGSNLSQEQQQSVIDRILETGQRFGSIAA